MRHTDWLRLKAEGGNICAVLRQQGYQCRLQTRRLSWQVRKDDHIYLLTWLPAPVGDWILLPNDTNPAREKLMSVVQSALSTPKSEALMADQQDDAGTLRIGDAERDVSQGSGSGPKSQGFESPTESGDSVALFQEGSGFPSQMSPRHRVSPSGRLFREQTQPGEDFCRPWMLVRLLPNAQRYTVARFYNRQDADDHKRVLQRFIPAAEFEVVFDMPESDHSSEEPA